MKLLRVLCFLVFCFVFVAVFFSVQCYLFYSRIYLSIFFLLRNAIFLVCIHIFEKVTMVLHPSSFPLGMKLSLSLKLGTLARPGIYK